jgi:cell division protein FtsI/penicillin-binding protein 2
MRRLKSRLFFFFIGALFGLATSSPSGSAAAAEPIKSSAVKTKKLVEKKTTTKTPKNKSAKTVSKSKQGKKFLDLSTQEDTTTPISDSVIRPPLDSAFTVAQSESGRVRLSRGVLTQLERGDRILKSDNGYQVTLSLDSELQRFASNLLRKYRVPWGAIVALDPSTGRIIAMSSYSDKQPWLSDISVSATYPAASIFKIVTSAAAIETSGLTGENLIRFRGGNYTLGFGNYLPDSKRDRRVMPLGEALGRSVNPVFARVAINYLTAETLSAYAKKFWFNVNLPTDVAVEISKFSLPIDDYELARTAAGFGDVTLSPLHAATLIGAVANKGVMMRPFFVDEISAEQGKIIYRNIPQPLQVILKRQTSEELMDMLQSTIEVGTAKKHFVKVSNPFLKNAAVAAKTGTLSGHSPKGVYHWFVGAAPVDRPRIAIATLIIDPGNARVKSAVLAREFLEKVFSLKEYRDRSYEGAADDKT